MRIIINGREMSERIDSLERKECNAIETINLLKTFSYIIGSVALIFSLDIFDKFILLGDFATAFRSIGSTAVGS